MENAVLPSNLEMIGMSLPVILIGAFIIYGAVKDREWILSVRLLDRKRMRILYGCIGGAIIIAMLFRLITDLHFS